MKKYLSLDGHAVGAAVGRAIMPLLTRQMFMGAAVACAAGLGAGLWLQLPALNVMERGSMSPLDISLPADEGAAYAAEPALATWSAPAASAATPQASEVSDDGDSRTARLIAEAQAGPPLRLEDAQPIAWTPNPTPVRPPAAAQRADDAGDEIGPPAARWPSVDGGSPPPRPPDSGE